MLTKLSNIPEIVLGFLLGAIFWIGALSWPAKHPETTQQNNSAQTSESKNHKDLRDERLADYTLLLAWFTGVLAVSTVGLWIVTWRAGNKQSRDMKESLRLTETAADAANRSAKISEDTLLAANRPWIAADIEIGDLTFTTSTKPVHFSFKCVLKNTGNTPGVGVEIYSKVILLEFGKATGTPPDVVGQSYTTNPQEGLMDLCNMARTFGDAAFPGRPITGDAIFPGNQLVDRVGIQLDAEEVERAKQTSFHKVISPILLVCVNYKSPLEKISHQTGYIFHVVTNDPAHPKGIDPDKGNIPAKNLGLIRLFANSFAN